MPKKVLVTDDALFMRTALKQILSSEGYNVIEAENGQKSIELYSVTKPDLVLMDITMPVMDGLTALKSILASDPRANVIVCSAMGQKNLVVEAIQSGAKDFIIKPFQPARVIEGVKKAIGAAA